MSYNVYWDKGTSGNEYHSIAGEIDNYTELNYVFTSLTKGLPYNFKYRVRNIYGFSEFSTITN